MPNKWAEKKLGDVLTLQRGFDLPETERLPGAYPVIASTGPVGTHNAAMAKGPGVVIGRSGSLGGGQYIRSDFWPLNTTLWVKDFKGNDIRFCYYLLKSLDLANFNSGSGVPTLNRNHIHPLPVQMPDSIEEQRAIAHILGTLDDKIELNRRMNEMLESIARAIFKYGFVDFDPVYAKAEGRDAGLPKEIADVFSDGFEDSELGEIPAGWRNGTLGDVATHLHEVIYPGDISPSMHYIALEHMPKRCIALDNWGVAAGLESNKFKFKKGEILFGKLRPYFHKVGIAPLDGVCSTDIVVVAPKAAKWHSFVFGHVSSTAFVDYTSAGSTGTKMPRTSWEQMMRYLIVIPSLEIAAEFDAQVRPLINRIFASIHESRALAALRDLMLPKLIFGELRVGDAERFIATKQATPDGVIQ
jgi:type I restriction enzyme S subunit